MSRPINAHSALVDSLRRVIILGSTGSIGTQTLEVLEHLNALHAQGKYPHRYQVVGLAARKNAGMLMQQAERWQVKDLALAESGTDASSPPGTWIGLSRVSLRTGPSAAETLVREVHSDIVVSSMVGASGLPATLAAVQLGRDIALANKESLVAAGALVIPAARASGSRLLPVDSEHAAIWQCLQGLTSPASAANPLCPPCRFAGPPRDPHGLRRPIPHVESPAGLRRDSGAGPQAPDLVDGREGHDRLGQPDEQGL